MPLEFPFDCDVIYKFRRPLKATGNSNCWTKQNYSNYFEKACREISQFQIILQQEIAAQKPFSLVSSALEKFSAFLLLIWILFLFHKPNPSNRSSRWTERLIIPINWVFEMLLNYHNKNKLLFSLVFCSVLWAKGFCNNSGFLKITKRTSKQCNRKNCAINFFLEHSHPHC